MGEYSRKIKTLVAYSLYVLVFTLVLPLLPIKLLWRAQKAPLYKQRILERFGVFALRPAAGGIWIHAVSVGEVIAAIPVIEALIKQYPDKTITVTTTTPTGSERLLAALQGRVNHVYIPYDWPLCVWLFLRKVRPCMAIVIETELWPVAFLFCKIFSIPMLIANARLSAKSAAGYQKINWLSRAMLREVWVAAQADDDAKRFVAVGANKNKVNVLGSVKFDVSVSDTMRDKAKAISSEFQTGEKSFVWIAASTHKGEDQFVLEGHKQLLEAHPDALLVIVPRHPERFTEVATLIDSYGLQYARRSAGDTVQQSSQVLLLDTMGELMLFYGASDFAFVGGSLVPVGGHNYHEPDSWGVPMISGPHQYNFAHIAMLLQRVNALSVVDSAARIYEALIAAVDNSESRILAGQAALAVIKHNSGASERLLTMIDRVMPQ